MLEFLSLENFKSARALEVPLNALTVLSGLNSSGKSTVLQAIGLIRQSLDVSDSPRLPNLYLRGSLVQLGLAEDVVSDQAGEETFTLTLGIDGRVTRLHASAQVGSDVLPLHHETLLPDPGEHYLRNCQFQFLQADRLTPRTHYDSSDSLSRELGFLGARGEFTPDFLAENGDRLEVSVRRRCPTAAEGLPASLMTRIVGTPKLYDQLAGWLQQVSPGVRLEAGRLSRTDLVALEFSYLSTQIAQGSSKRRPSNVGFGLTYCLPVVTALLAAPAGALLLLENPEAHLHPRGQAALGTLLAKCAADGVQVIVETHSDHLLNGIRLAVKHRELPPANVNICNFTRDPLTGDSYIEVPVVLPNGELTAWPVGFFDEWEKSLEELLR